MLNVPLSFNRDLMTSFQEDSQFTVEQTDRWQISTDSRFCYSFCLGFDIINRFMTKGYIFSLRITIKQSSGMLNDKKRSWKQPLAFTSYQFISIIIDYFLNKLNHSGILVL